MMGVALFRSELLPRPHCGDYASVEGNYAYGIGGRHPNPEHDDNHTLWYAECNNRDDVCPGNPDITGATRHEVIEAWNEYALANSQPIEQLAMRLRWQIDRLDPGLEEICSWSDAPNRERELYRLLIEDLARYPDLWKRLFAGYGGKDD